jgi:hypothetical protein
MFEQSRYLRRHAINELEAMASDPQFAPDQVPILRRQIAAETAFLDATVYEPLRPTNRRTIMMVFACRNHSVDLDEATRLHEADCLAAGPCACVTGESALTAPGAYDPELVSAGDGFK